MAPLTLQRNQVQVHEEDEEFQEQETRSDLQELKITAQVIGYHALKFMLPVIAVSVTLACGFTLSFWALNQLNKLPIQAFPASSAAVDKNNLDSSKDKQKDMAPAVVHPTAPKKTRKVKAQVPSKAQPRKYPQRRTTYQDPWAEYYYYEPSHPRGGEIIHSDGMVTEYRWNKKH